MKKQRLTLSERCKQAKQTRMWEFLDWLGFQPVSDESGRGEQWYLSPFRQETEASFKLSRDGGAWFDHGAGEGGNILDFAMAYFRTDLRGAVEEVERMRDGAPPPKNAAPSPPPSTPKIAEKEEFVILGIQPVTSLALKRYLEKRGIPVEVAARYLKEIHYERGEKLYFALAFENASGGYELRNAYFKGAHGTKDITLLLLGAPEESHAVSVFEGFMDFLSAVVLSGRQPEHPVIVMNSVAMKEKTIEAIKQLGAQKVDLYLDRDEAGKALTAAFQHMLPSCTVTDRSTLYDGQKDLNDWLIAKRTAVQAKAPERC